MTGRPFRGRDPLRGREPESRVDDELRFHLEEAVDGLVARGVPEDEARRRVLAEFGNLDGIRNECREIVEERVRRQRRGETMTSVWRDAVLAIRRLRHNPGFTAAALLTLALGIGATVAMYVVVEGVVLKPLPYPDSERLVRVWPGMNFNIALADRFRELPALASLTGASGWSFTLKGEGGAEQLQGSAVDPDFFAVLGARPAIGRGFLPEERHWDRADVAVLSYGLWQRRFGSDPEILGKRIELDGQRFGSRRVVGVMPPGFRPLVEGAEVWVPLGTRAGLSVANDSSWYVNQVVARLAPGATLEEAQAEIRSRAQLLLAEFPGRLREEQVRGAGAIGLLDATVGDVRSGLWILLGAVALVLVMACGNVANLTLAEGARRSRDAAVRAALGASPGRLVRQGLTESAALAALGGGLGVLLAWWLLRALGTSLSLALPRTEQLGMSSAVVAFAVAVSAASVLLFGLVPALRFGWGWSGGALRWGGRAGTGRSGGLSRWLVAAETALAVILVVGAALLLRSFWLLYGTDPGFRAEGVLVAEVATPGAEDPSKRAELLDYYRRVQERIESLPGVTSVGAIHLLPLTANNWSFPYLPEGLRPSADEPLPSANFRIVGPGYFRTLEIPVRAGRLLEPEDGQDDRPAMLVNEAMAERLWPGVDPVGKEIRLFGNMPHRVVGVVGDVRQHSLDRAPEPEMYVSYRRWSAGSFYFMVRTTGDPAALAGPVRSAIAELNPDVPIPLVTPLTHVVGGSVARARFFAFLLAGFGAVAFVLGAVGVYGVMAHHVAGRLREFGVRMALGASAGGVVRTALGRGLVPVGAGLGAGLAGALVAGRLLEGLLYQVSPADPATYAIVALFLGAVAVVATWVPARRASQVDPVKVLGVQ